MKLISPPSKKCRDESVKNAFFRRNRACFVLILLSFILVSILSYFVTTKYFPRGIKKYFYDKLVERGHDYYQKDSSICKTLLQIPHRVLADVVIPKVRFDVKFKHMQKIYRIRQSALQRGVLIQGGDDFVPAEMRLAGGDSLRIKMRLKGDWTDHLEGKKWSFRIHTKGRDRFFGMRRFSIQHPATRGFQGEILFHETIRYFGGLAPKYFFVDVVINGKHIGIMAVEEHFSKELLERNGRKEGVIICFDESKLWEAVDGTSRGFQGAFDNYMNADIKAFQLSKIHKSSRLLQEYQVAVGLLRGFVEGTLMPSDVFDVKQTGSFLAVSEYFGSWHAVRWHNLRFYLNPLTMKLEPIAFDAHLDLRPRKPAGMAVTAEEPVARKLLDDPAIYEAYKRTLQQLVRETQTGKLIARLRHVEAVHLAGLQKEFFMLQPFDFQELKRIQTLGKPSTQDARAYPVYLHATRIEQDRSPYLELRNALPYLVEIQSLYWRSKDNHRIPLHVIDTELPFVLPQTKWRTMPEIRRIYYAPIPKGKRNYQLEVLANIRGRDGVKSHIAHLGYPSLAVSPLPVTTIAQQLSRHSFLKRENGKKRIAVQPGTWQVKGDIVIPQGYEVVISAGTQLCFETESSFVIFGRTRFIGTENAPIILSAQGEQDRTWEGLAIYHAGKRSQWSYVYVFNTSGVAWPLWKLTGGVTFYKSDVDLANCVFTGSRGEDALNLIHSDFTLRDSTIAHTVSDAVDADFASGKIVGGSCKHIGTAGGGDGVDISGSVITLEGMHFDFIHDKALSVGEGSDMTASKLIIENANIAAASKDGSTLRITDSVIRRSTHFALMAYIKKPEYGSARIIANHVTIIDTQTPVLAQQGNFITVDGKVVHTENINIDRLYKTIMKSENDT